ncbi:MAG TPA: ABC transporter permease [Pyrinomonadaceae bacterium]|nr:ABC transporter permease [Pyrinomonadaceae bacterium]
MTKDLRYGLRMLAKNPGVSAIAVLTLALGIGANTAIFSVVSAVLLNPLPYKDPDRLVSIWENVPEHGRWRAAPANFLDWKKQNTVFEDVAAFGGATATLTGDGDPEQLSGTAVTPGYFEVVGVQPALGRVFQPEEYQLGTDRVVILGHGLWQRRYGADKNIVNRNITLDGNSYTVVGVMPPGLYPTRPTTAGRIDFDERGQDYWRPFSAMAHFAALRGAHIVGVLARLKPEVTFEQATAEMNTIGARLAQEHAENKDEGIIVTRFMNEVVGDVRPALVTLLVAVGLVLLIACANIAGLLLAQHAARTKEIAIRAALGAGRKRLVRQFFVEGLLLSLCGTLAGLAVAQLGLQVLLKFVPPQMIPRLAQVGLDWRVLGFTLLLSLVTCLLFGLVPAWQASKPDLQTALEQSGRTSGPGAARLRFRQLLVVFQVSVAVMLVIGAGLLIKSFWMLQRVDPGFKAQRVLSAGITLPVSKYREPLLINNFFNQLSERVAAVPGVESVSIAYDHPLQSNWLDSFEIEGRAGTPENSESANFIPVGPDYFNTVGVQAVSGRTFTPRDDADHPGVAIVNEAFVRHYFPNENPLGRRIRPSPPGRIWDGKKLTSFEIVGVVRDVKFDGLAEASEPAYYLPATQSPLNDMTILVRTTSDPQSIISGLRQAVWAIDPNQPLSNVNTLEQIVSESIAQPRLNMLLMMLFGGLALLLSAVGIYGLLSYAVTQRTQELGIRMALGANVTDVLKLVLKQGMFLALAGEVIGLAGAFALTRLMRGLLFGVTPTDTTIFAGVVAVLTLTALLACYLPARRATKVDPLVALRYE